VKGCSERCETQSSLSQETEGGMPPRIMDIGTFLSKIIKEIEEKIPREENETENSPDRQGETNQLP